MAIITIIARTSVGGVRRNIKKLAIFDNDEFSSIKIGKKE